MDRGNLAMARVDGWEKRLKAAIEKHSKLPSEYGVSDCYLIADDSVEAVTGERLYPDVSYSSELGAAKELKRRGFDNVEEAFAAVLESIPPALAQRGDIGTTMNANGEICGGVFTGVGFMVRDEIRVRYISIKNVHAAFKVGR